MAIAVLYVKFFTLSLRNFSLKCLKGRAVLNDRITNIAGVVLAGGKCRRMGGVDKAFISIDGQPIIHRTLEILSEIFDEVILVSNSPEKYYAYKNDIVIVSDLIPDVGPLAGIYTAMSSTEKDAVFVTACDMPFLDKAFIEKELTCFDALSPEILFPRTGDHIEPLCALYSTKIMGRMASYIQSSSDHSIRSFAATVDTQYLELKDSHTRRKMFSNVNCQDDVRRTRGSKEAVDTREKGIGQLKISNIDARPIRGDSAAL